MEAPILSIIVSMYNAESTIERLLDSVVEQTLNNIELILIDDCSNDNTAKIAEEKLAGQKLQYTLIKNEKNQGQSLCRKLGLSKASGDFISFIDADDWLEPSMYKLMHDTAEEKNADIVTCDHFLEYSNKTKENEIVSNYSTDLIDGILTNKVAGSLWNKIFKRDLFDSSIIWPKLNMGEDGAICIQLILKAKTIAHLDSPLYHYYINPNSTINRISKEDYLRRSVGLKESSDIIFKRLSQYGISNKYSLSILFRKVHINILASPIIDDKKSYKTILSLYPDLSIFKILYSSLSFSMKLRYMLFRTRLYPHLTKIKTFIKR